MGSKEYIEERIRIIKYLFYSFTDLNPNEISVDIEVEGDGDLDDPNMVEALFCNFDINVQCNPELLSITKKLNFYEKKIDLFFSTYEFDGQLKIIKKNLKPNGSGGFVSNLKYDIDTEEIFCELRMYIPID